MIYLRFSILLICTVLAAVSTAEIYRWVDDKGQVHFGDKPLSGNYDVIEQDQKEGNSEDTEEDSADLKLENSSEENVEIQADQDIPVGVENDADEVLSEEAARKKRVQDMEALAEELRTAREKREGIREKEKEELRNLRVGCKNAQRRITYLQSKIDRYTSRQTKKKFPGNRVEGTFTLDKKHERIMAELRSRRQYVNENCTNL